MRIISRVVPDESTNTRKPTDGIPDLVGLKKIVHRGGGVAWTTAANHGRVPEAGRELVDRTRTSLQIQPVKGNWNE
jgi:hypothetical protein